MKIFFIFVPAKEKNAEAAQPLHERMFRQDIL